jgi:hypothetical protein
LLPIKLNFNINFKCKTWCLTLNEHRVKVFENGVQRGVIEHKREEVTGNWRKLHNQELQDL